MFFSNTRTRIIVLCVLFFSISIGKGIAQETKKLNARVISSFPSPGPSPQGLAWDGKNLWVVDDSTNRIYKIEPNTGKTLLSFEAPSRKPKGLTWDGNYLILLENQKRKIYKIVSSGKALGSVIASNDLPLISDIPSNKISPWGLVWDGNYIYFNFEAGWSSQIVKYNISTQKVAKVNFTKGFPRGLAWDGEYLWNIIANSKQDSKYKAPANLIKYDPISGKEIISYSIPLYFPAGLIFDGKKFWVADEKEGQVYEIVVEE